MSSGGPIRRLQAAGEYSAKRGASGQDLEALIRRSDHKSKADLTDADRAKYLENADDLYSKVIAADDKSPQKALLR